MKSRASRHALDPISRTAWAASGAILTVVLGVLAGCGGGSDDDPGGSGGTSGATGGLGGDGGSGAAGTGATGTGGSGATSTGGSGTGGSGGGGPASCAAAAAPYTLTSVAVGDVTPEIVRFHWGGEHPNLPVVANAAGELFVGFTDAGGAGLIPVSGGARLVTIPGARLAGLTPTSNGFGLLLFDSVDELWAAVRRIGADGSTVFDTDLYRSANLDDLWTKGEASTGRLAYVAGTDELIPYFAHQMRWDDGVRHEGGYLARVSAAGEQTVLDDWHGSHNLDQRVLVTASGDVALYALGDAYPVGLLFSYLSDPATNVVNDILDAQVGNIVEVGGELVLSYVAGVTLYQAYTGEPAPAAIRIGLMRFPTGTVPSAAEPLFIEPAVEDGRYVTYLHTAPYGSSGELLLLAWRESGAWGDAARYFTQIVDLDGNTCQPKTEVPAARAFLGDDFLVRPDGSLVWANAEGGGIEVVTLTPP